MFIENYKRDKNNLAIIAVNTDSINNHRNSLRQKEQFQKYLTIQKEEISSLKEEISELKNIVLNLINHKS